ncbi:DUF916 and DUF3324 domain-containing protein [Enterococcus ureasiticus]|uniref:Uncharacterized protein n=1 Tax=Enterococcus ureasiticus TaxID=903984 RepID=A0A1E5GN09_9ENTE|nr:DUF916 and DUF3324 domain-containing protein [Enterococcus ureasiticus]OEG13985.1 hypothetical protein BCR21_03055 [Enterococcus ureasiticus]
MKKFFQQSFITFFLILSIFFVQTQVSNATSDPSGAVGFLYKTNHPENQIDDSGYFNLKMTPGQKQKVSITLTNLGKKEVTVEVNLNGARTNSNGVLEYGKTKLDKDASMKFDFTDIVKGPKEITLPPESDKDLELEINMPETSYDGIILGGIQLQKVSDEEEKKENTGTTIINEYAYTIAMLLKENDTKVEPKMGYLKTYGTQPNGRNTITVDLANQATDLLEDLTVEVQIMPEKKDEVLYESKKTKMRMAPNSVLNYPVTMEGQPMVPGQYRAHVTANSGDKKWEWTEMFTITKEEADKFNREDIGMDQERGIDFKLVGMIVGGVIGFFLIMFLIIRFVTNKKSKKKKRMSKKR